MDDVEAFVRRYLDAEADARRAVLVEPDDVLSERLAEARGFLAPRGSPRMTFDVGRGPGATHDELAAQADQASAIRPRDLFQIVEHRSAEHGQVWAAYVGPTMDFGRRQYDARWWVAHVDDQLRLVADERLTMSEDPAAIEWEHLKGRPMDDVGPPLAIRQFVAPEITAEAAHYKEMGRHEQG
jgi:hypothetical protein